MRRRYLSSPTIQSCRRTTSSFGSSANKNSRQRRCRLSADPRRRLLEDTIAQHPHAFRPRLLLSHVLLHKDLSAAEQSLRDVLALDPNHQEARRNLTVLLQEMGRAS
jgi:hypothetical protein